MQFSLRVQKQYALSFKRHFTSYASYVLKPNKACAKDTLANEMISGLIEVKPELILKLFNKVFENYQKIEEWSIGLISPIFKSGVKMDPGNYRGISVLSCLGKLFSSVLN